MTSDDCVDIEQLGYAYGPGSLDVYAEKGAGLSSDAVDLPQAVHVAGIDRSKVAGSFVSLPIGTSTASSSFSGRGRPEPLDRVGVRELSDASARQRGPAGAG